MKHFFSLRDLFPSYLHLNEAYLRCLLFNVTALFSSNIWRWGLVFFLCFSILYLHLSGVLDPCYDKKFGVYVCVKKVYTLCSNGDFSLNRPYTITYTHTHSTTIDTLPHLISVQTSPHTLVLALRVCSVIHLSVYSSTCAWMCESMNVAPLLSLSGLRQSSSN